MTEREKILNTMNDDLAGYLFDHDTELIHEICKQSAGGNLCLNHTRSKCLDCINKYLDSTESSNIDTRLYEIMNKLSENNEYLQSIIFIIERIMESYLASDEDAVLSILIGIKYYLQFIEKSFQKNIEKMDLLLLKNNSVSIF